MVSLYPQGLVNGTAYGPVTIPCPQPHAHGVLQPPRLPVPTGPCSGITRCTREVLSAALGCVLASQLA